MDYTEKKLRRLNTYEGIIINDKYTFFCRIFSLESGTVWSLYIFCFF